MDRAHGIAADAEVRIAGGVRLAEDVRPIVFNADDLGLSPGANAGILAAVEAGAVREVSVCVTGAAADEGLAIVRSLPPRCGVGLHVNLTEGDALTGAIPGLTDASGRFPSLGTVLRLGLLGRLDGAALAVELDAQLERLLATGVEPSHLNGHHQVHLFPGVRAWVRQALRAHGIPHVRLPAESRRTAGRFRPRRWLLERLSRGFAREAAREHLPATTLPFVGLAIDSRRGYEPALRDALAKLPSGGVEWMIHPHADHAGRAEELAFFRDVDVAARLEALRVRPVGYRDLAPQAPPWAGDGSLAGA